MSQATPIDCQYIVDQLDVISQANKAGATQVIDTVIEYLRRHLQAPATRSEPIKREQSVQSVLPIGFAAKPTCQWIAMIKAQIKRSGVGDFINFDEFARWAEFDSGIKLTGGDLETLKGGKIRWRTRLSNAFQRLKEKGVLSNESNTRDYRIERMP